MERGTYFTSLIVRPKVKTQNIMKKVFRNVPSAT